MQVIHKDEVEGGSSRGTDSINIIICPRSIGRYLKGECYGEIRDRGDRI